MSQSHSGGSYFCYCSSTDTCAEELLTTATVCIRSDSISQKSELFQQVAFHPSSRGGMFSKSCIIFSGSKQRCPKNGNYKLGETFPFILENKFKMKSVNKTTGLLFYKVLTERASISDAAENWVDCQ